MAEKHIKLTLEELLARREQSLDAKKQFSECDVPELGGVLVVEKLPVREVISIIDGHRLNTMMDGVDANIDLVYRCCPVLHDKQLHEAYGITVPTDIVLRVLDDNLGALNRVAEFILGLYGAADKDAVDEAVDDVKN